MQQAIQIHNGVCYNCQMRVIADLIGWQLLPLAFTRDHLLWVFAAYVLLSDDVFRTLRIIINNKGSEKPLW